MQMAALISKTLVGEARRTWRAIATSTITRRFNLWAIEIRRKAEPDKAKRDKMKRVEGRHRIELFITFLRDFRKMVRRARRLTSDERKKAIKESIATTRNKSSADEDKKRVSDFERAVKRPEKTYQAELVSGYQQTATMGGRVLFSFLSKANGVRLHLPIEDAIDKEIMARKIPTDNEDFLKQHGEDAVLTEIPINAKKKYLKLHEARLRMKKNTSLNEEEAVKKTDSLEPFCEEMVAVLESQNVVV